MFRSVSTARTRIILNIVVWRRFSHKFLFSIKRPSYKEETSNFPLKINLFVASSWLLNTKNLQRENENRILTLHLCQIHVHVRIYIFWKILLSSWSRSFPFHLLRTFGPSLFRRDKLWAAKWLTLVGAKFIREKF